MSQVIVVTSGKGGVGKTTSAASIATGIAQAGFKTVVIDFDVGLRNLDLVLGCENRVVYDIINVIHGEAKLAQALIKDKKTNLLSILPASQTRDKNALTNAGVSLIINELKQTFDYIICDSPAGIEHGAIAAMFHADQAIIVTNPEISSVRDSDRILGLLASKTEKAQTSTSSIKEHLLITRYDEKRVKQGEMLSIDDIVEILSIPLLGVIPESDSILKASNIGVPIFHNQRSTAGHAYKLAVNKLLGIHQTKKTKNACAGFFTKFLPKFARSGV